MQNQGERRSSFQINYLRSSIFVPDGAYVQYPDINRHIGKDEHDAYSNDGFGADPASSDAIAALTEETVDEMGEEDACTVCLEGFKEGDKLRKMPCNHGFHERVVSSTGLGLSAYCHFVHGPIFAPHRVHAQLLGINLGNRDNDDAYRNGGFNTIPASNDAIAALPEMTMGETREEEACTICLEGPSYVPHGVESVYFSVTRDIGEDDEAYSDDEFGAVPASSDTIAALPETTVRDRDERGGSMCKRWLREAFDDVPDTSHMSDEQFHQFLDQYWDEQGFNIRSWIRASRSSSSSTPGPTRQTGPTRFALPNDIFALPILSLANTVPDDGNGNGPGGATPASSMAIVSLPEMTVGEEKGQVKDCPLCLQGFEEGDKLRKMPCADSHCFHEQCIFSWLLINRHCPLCRFPLPAETEEEEEVVQAENDDDDDGEETILCMHRLSSCSFEWLQVSRLCPLCRLALPTKAEAGLWPLPTPGSGSGT
uniref:RING-type domain-containing protein n=1 Tax=Oryza punctata TaxID=4537 RepID=A0A0E0MCC0_ORYPU